MVIVEIKGKQYSIKEGALLKVDRLSEEVGADFNDIKVLYHSDDKGNIRVGTPYLNDIKVTAKVKEQFRDDKVMVMHYKKRSGIRKKQGHRQSYTRIEIQLVSAVKKSEAV